MIANLNQHAVCPNMRLRQKDRAICRSGLNINLASAEVFLNLGRLLGLAGGFLSLPAASRHPWSKLREFFKIEKFRYLADKVAIKASTILQLLGKMLVESQ